MGLDVSSTWDGLINGRSGATTSPVSTRLISRPRSPAKSKGLTRPEYTSRKESRRMDRFALLALSATKQALDDAGLEVTSENADQIGTIIGTGIGGIETLSSQFPSPREEGARPGKPLLMHDDDGEYGGRPGLDSTRRAGTQLLHGVGLLKWRTMRSVKPTNRLARGCERDSGGGTEAPVVPISVATFNSMRALSTQNDPPGEGEPAIRRQARRLRTWRGSGGAGGRAVGACIGSWREDPGRDCGLREPRLTLRMLRHTAENGTGARIAMDIALKRGCIPPTDVDYVNAHGTSTQLNDLAETKAIKHLFCDHSRKLSDKLYQVDDRAPAWERQALSKL